MPGPVRALCTAVAVGIAAAHGPAIAQTSDPFACMDTGYSAADQARIDAYVAGFDLEQMDPEEPLSEALARRATECAGSLGAGALMPLLQHQFSALMIDGIAARQPEVIETVRRIDTKLDPALRARFYRVFEASVFGAISGLQSGGLSEQDERFFTDTILMPPVSGTEDQAEGIGGYLAARVMQREAREHLAALTAPE